MRYMRCAKNFRRDEGYTRIVCDRVSVSLTLFRRMGLITPLLLLIQYDVIDDLHRKTAVQFNLAHKLKKLKTF